MEASTSSSSQVQRAPIWRDGAPKHIEFLALCEQKQWDTLPVMGADSDLDNFWKKGLNNDGVEFTRNQLMSKFQKWKSTRELAAAESEERFIEGNEVKVTKDIIVAVKKIDFFKDSINGTPHEMLLNHPEAIELLEELRDSSIVSVNGALGCSDVKKIVDRTKISLA
jgi:hypothetical protein